MPVTPEEEIADLRAEVVSLRAELAEDRWRMNRLAELGVVQAKINHDMRNIMTSALMVADRLSTSADPKVSRSGTMLVTLFEQASALVNRTLDFAGEKPPVLSPSRFALAALVAEITEELCAQHHDFAVENTAPDHVFLEADRAHLGRAIGNLLRAAAKAQARQAVVHVEDHAGMVAIVVTDDGRPFRDVTAATAFRPFAGTFRYGSTGLGFIIARDVIQAHGGDIAIRTESPDGRTCVVLRLPTTP